MPAGLNERGEKRDSHFWCNTITIVIVVHLSDFISSPPFHRTIVILITSTYHRHMLPVCLSGLSELIPKLISIKVAFFPSALITSLLRFSHSKIWNHNKYIHNIRAQSIVHQQKRSSNSRTIRLNIVRLVPSVHCSLSSPWLVHYHFNYNFRGCGVCPFISFVRVLFPSTLTVFSPLSFASSFRRAISSLFTFRSIIHTCMRRRHLNCQSGNVLKIQWKKTRKRYRWPFLLSRSLRFPLFLVIRIAVQCLSTGISSGRKWQFTYTCYDGLRATPNANVDWNRHTQFNRRHCYKELYECPCVCVRECEKNTCYGVIRCAYHMNISWKHNK